MKIKSLFFVLTFFALQACNNYSKDENGSFPSQFFGGVTGNGDVIKQQRQVGSYSKISSKGSVDVVLTDGKVGNLTVEAESNLADFVETEVVENELQIKIKKNANINTHKGITVYVAVNELTSIKSSGSGDIIAEKKLSGSTLKISSAGSGDIKMNSLNYNDLTVSISGSGDFSSNNINAEKTKISVAGSGDVDAAGKVNYLIVSIAGSSDVKAGHLVANEVEVSISGSGNAEVNAQKTISASVSGSGNVGYTGSAAVTKFSVSGSGGINKM
ncbi:MAG: DUF2807 domain-containing protein [Flavobacteriaceae bacterium]|jgi:hypothetical protein|nr:DUF2807 domain-containing protein [Flavobacteriaceae bacterium]